MNRESFAPAKPRWLLLFGLAGCLACAGASSGDESDPAAAQPGGSGGTRSTGQAGSVSAPGGGVETGPAGGVSTGGGQSCTGAVAPDGRMFCDVMADYSVHCEGATRQDALSYCQQERAPHQDRIDCRFVEPWGACLDTAACDAGLEDCFTEALLAFDPTLVGFAAARQCAETGDCPDELPDDLLRDCVVRMQECDGWDDLCTNAIILQEQYKSQLAPCLAQPCEQVESCVAALTGDTV